MSFFVAGMSRLKGLINALVTALTKSTMQPGPHSAALELAYQLERNIKKEWIAGGHNNNGPEDELLGRPRTIDTTEVRATAFGAECSIWGAASFVESPGTREHIIVAHASTPHGLLIFEGDYGLIFATEVSHPGYKGDPFIERAIAELDFTGFSVSVVQRAYAFLQPGQW